MRSATGLMTCLTLLTIALLPASLFPNHALAKQGFYGAAAKTKVHFITVDSGDLHARFLPSYTLATTTAVPPNSSSTPHVHDALVALRAHTPNKKASYWAIQQAINTSYGAVVTTGTTRISVDNNNPITATTYDYTVGKRVTLAAWYPDSQGTYNFGPYTKHAADSSTALITLDTTDTVTFTTIDNQTITASVRGATPAAFFETFIHGKAQFADVAQVNPWPDEQGPHNLAVLINDFPGQVGPTTSELQQVIEGTGNQQTGQPSLKALYDEDGVHYTDIKYQRETMATPSGTDPCSATWIQAEINSATAKDSSLNSYKQFAVFNPPNLINCNRSANTFWVYDNVSQVPVSEFYRAVLPKMTDLYHEVGHGLAENHAGIIHSSPDPNTFTSTNITAANHDEYGADNSVMTGFGIAGKNVIDKRVLGSITNDQVLTVTQSTDVSIDARSLISKGKKIIRVLRRTVTGLYQGNPQEYDYIELQTPIGNDRLLGKTQVNGIIWDERFNGFNVDPDWQIFNLTSQPGRNTGTDGDTGVSFTVESISNNTARIHIVFAK